MIRPPPISDILALPEEPRDVAYECGLLSGVQGTWHRLWSALSSAEVMPGEGWAETIAAIREELEGLLGRPLSPAEFAALQADAERHAHQVLAPIIQRHT